MSGSANVNINDKSVEKISAEKTYNTNAAETETKASAPGTVGNTTASSVNDLNKTTDMAGVQKNDNNISNERCDKDVKLKVEEDKDGEQGASGLQTTDCSENEKSGEKETEGESKESPSASEGAAAESVEAESKDSEEGTKSVEESFKKLKMNIDVDKTCPCHQSVTGSAANRSSPDSASNEQNSQVEDQAGDKEKEGAAEDKDDVSKEANDCDTHKNGTTEVGIASDQDLEAKVKDGAAEVVVASDQDLEAKDGAAEVGVQHSENSEDAVTSNQKGKSGLNSEEKNSNVEMESEPEETPQRVEDTVSSVTDQSRAKLTDTGSGQNETEKDNKDWEAKVTDTGSGQDKKDDEDGEAEVTDTGSGQDKKDDEDGGAKVTDTGSGQDKKDDEDGGAKVTDTGNGQDKKDDEDGGASGGAEDSMKEEVDDNLKPSDFVPARLAAVRRQWSERDTQIYRDGYPGKEDDPLLTKNLDFYQGRIPCSPDGDYIHMIHKYWWDNHEWLEIHHGYIQWLFPIRESGMNWLAQELQLHEAQAIMADEKAMKRFKTSYKMMLNFYGIKLISTETGEVERAPNWHQRFQHLNYSMHNYLRITRILKCLGELGLECFKAPLLRFLLYEAILSGHLHRALDSCYNYWLGTVRDDQERRSLHDYAVELCRQLDHLDALGRGEGEAVPGGEGGGGGEGAFPSSRDGGQQFEP